MSAFMDDFLTRTEPEPSRQPTVDHVDDEGGYDSAERYSPISTPDSSSNTPSDAFAGMTEKEISEELSKRFMPTGVLTRRDWSQVLTSRWGLVEPKNFGEVLPGIYRSSYPKPENFTFLRSKGIKTILTLVDKPFTALHEEFLVRGGVTHIRIVIEPNKNPDAFPSPVNMLAALGVVLDPTNYPILIHCNKGKHRTGCVVGCLRKVVGWDFRRIIEEYRQFAAAKARVLDERFLEAFDERSLLWLASITQRLRPGVGLDGFPSSALTVSRLRG